MNRINLLKICQGLLFVITTVLTHSVFADSGEGTSASIRVSTKYGISGIVVDAQSGNAISGASVVLTAPGNQTFTYTTATDGSFSSNSMPLSPFTVEISANGYQSEIKTFNTTETCLFSVIGLDVPDSNCIKINPSLRICADEIVEVQPYYYRLTGNPVINGILSIDGQVMVDKRPHLYYPEISANGNLYALDIQGTDVLVSSGTGLNVYVDGNTLNPKDWKSIIGSPILMGGFNMDVCQIIVDGDGNSVELKSFMKMPFPVDLIFAKLWEEAKHPINLVSKLGFSDLYSKDNGRSSTGNISGLGINFGAFSIKDLSLYFNTSTQVFGGGFSLSIPGDPPDVLKSGSLTDSSSIDSLLALPLVLVNSTGMPADTLLLDSLIGKRTFLGADLIRLSVQMEFVSGSIHEFRVSVGAKVPLFATGLYITEATGGISNFTKLDNWRVLANFDIETGLNLPVLGSPIKINDVGGEVHPWDHFKLSGVVEIFGQQVSGAILEYSPPKKALVGEAQLDLAGIILGKANLSLKSGDFSGGGEFTVKTPPVLPWKFKWAQNRVIGSSAASFHNNNIWLQRRIFDFGIAMRLEYGNPNFPYFHYYLGSNYEEMSQIWKGAAKGKSAVQFQVPENCPGMMVIVGDTVNQHHVSISLQDPSGGIWDSTNTSYTWVPESSQTIIVVENPVKGNWSLVANSFTNVRTEFLFQDQAPGLLVGEPVNAEYGIVNCRMDITDFNDTLAVRVFYDTDSLDFDGVVIESFEVVNNAVVDYVWQTGVLPDGEYFMYAEVSDGKNVPVRQYSNGAVLLNTSGITEHPEGIVHIQKGDSLEIQWAGPVNPILTTALFYLHDPANSRTEQIAVVDDTVAMFFNLRAGVTYELWGRFISPQGVGGSVSDTILIYVNAFDTANHPPVITLAGPTIWRLTEGEQDSLLLTAVDADQDSLAFNLLTNIQGLVINGNVLSWTPSASELGAHRILFSVGDGNAIDTAALEAVVYSQDDVKVRTGYSSRTLYEKDVKFARIVDYQRQVPNIQVLLMNVRSGDSVAIECRKVNEFEFIGTFEVSAYSSSMLGVMHGDTIRLKYFTDGTAYFADAIYDSLPQPNDQSPPAGIQDISANLLRNNGVLLTWTSPGDDGMLGRAFAYDIRYSSSPILNENDFFMANRISQVPYPSPSGRRDSLVIALDSLEGLRGSDSLWLVIKTEDEQQNWSPLGNLVSVPLQLAPLALNASISDRYVVSLDWDTLAVAGLDHFRILRGIDDGSLSLLADSILSTAYSDDLYAALDGSFTYGVQAIYSNGSSDTIFSSPIDLDRFTDGIILFHLEDASIFDSVHYSIASIDSIYSMNYAGMTNSTGLVHLPGLFKGDYRVSAVRAGYQNLVDTVSVGKENSSFVIMLYDEQKERMITGFVVYDDQTRSSIHNVMVKVKDLSGNVLDTAFTDSLGYFSAYLNPGEYVIETMIPIPWGGCDSIDVHTVMEHFVDFDSLSGLRFLAGDVNVTGNINAIDALLMSRRINGLSGSFLSGNWVPVTHQVSVRPGLPQQVILKVLATGDVDASYRP
ncbi:MAG TPA: carboxypeptidase regulatory-like domain-containing protein [Bacteroidales bacterium]|nr:carboxypeptidase regulatory-like domain-containing protein [Bacteroidales bacterium]